jgi:quercetin dioxygenase-like cupin family protein
LVVGGAADACPGTDAEDPAHGDAAALASAGGITAMDVRWLVTAETRGARSLAVACSAFTGAGTHELHRHPHADEFFLVLDGGGEHLTETGPVRLVPGDLVHIPAGEWHGFRTAPGVTTRTVYGYLGAPGLAGAGYELLADGAAPTAAHGTAAAAVSGRGGGDNT